MSSPERTRDPAASVGLIANPVAGKDVRRLVALASTFDNQEKVRIVRRVLTGLQVAGSRQVYYLRDSFGIVERAAQHMPSALDLRPIPIPCTFLAHDSELAARWLSQHGARCIITLGGDGTNRMVARGCGDVPILPLATGTNNVFPYLIEGTIAGLAAGLWAAQFVSPSLAQRQPRLEIWVDNVLVDIALIDVAISRERFLATRAIWNPETIERVIVARIEPGIVGLAALATALLPDHMSPQGMVIDLGSGPLRVTVPLAPGLICTVPIRQWSPLAIGAVIPITDFPCTLALDGERELRIERACTAAVQLSGNGPLVLDPRRILADAARRGCLRHP